jgi:HD-GYP domain-containing protein (c-di-GMP phosphodiesterase class II)
MDAPRGILLILPIAVLALVVLVAWLINRRRRLEAQLEHYHAVSLEAQLRAQRQLANSARSLEEKVAERTFELDDARAETLQLLAAAVEYRDDETAEHTERVGALAAQIASRVGLRSEQVKRLREAAALHDVGKIAIPDRILLKRGNLTPEEHDAMQAHAALGARLLSRSSSPVLQMAAVIAATHHEWWNGTGYPSGLGGERIPLVGRIVAVADVFDALTHERPYKAAWPVGQAVARIKRGSGSQFDPRVVTAFVSLHEEVVVPVPTGSDGAARRFIPGGAPRQPAATLIPAGVTGREREPVRSINP